MGKTVFCRAAMRNVFHYFRQEFDRRISADLGRN